MSHPVKTDISETADGFREHYRTLGGAASSRRSFLGVLLGAGASGVGALLSVPLLRFLLARYFQQIIEQQETEKEQAEYRQWGAAERAPDLLDDLES